ncbi:MAG: M23 family metallopeptidase [Spirochaetaceae bacterium]|jgi:murein DD-endopeptidase MepM/ murein hydrolase activator NlpD|nr:M23 family metallopeptidase [Spirochaetaceae bacterium]
MPKLKALLLHTIRKGILFVNNDDVIWTCKKIIGFTVRLGVLYCAVLVSCNLLWGMVWGIRAARSTVSQQEEVLVAADNQTFDEDAMGGTSTLNPVTLNIAEAEGEEDLMLAGAELPEVFTRTLPLLYTAYQIQQGDTISELATSFGLNQDTLISVNGFSNTRFDVWAGDILKVPNQDGIFYTVSEDDTLESLAEKYEVSAESIAMANQLFSEKILAGKKLFIPGAEMDSTTLQEINGDLFRWPLRGYRYLSSLYGYRRDPFGSGTRVFHTGIDIPAPTGTPAYAAMAGKVSIVGNNATFGNYVIINHHSGYQSLYGHLNKASIRQGAYVVAGQKIGEVGSTGLSTGPHLHFTVYKNRRTVNPRLYTH